MEAIAAGLESIEGHGRDPDRATIGPVGAASLARCARATFEAEYEIPAISLPFIGGYGQAPFRVRSTHSELVDPFRSGVPGIGGDVLMTSTGRERASVLMLMPAGVLVVLLLGAIAFDLSLVFLRQRQASSLAVDVANDLATAALDEESVPSRRHL